MSTRQYVVTRQGDAVQRDDDQVVIGEADPVVFTRPAWSGQSPGTVWHEYHLPALAEFEAEGR